MTLIVKTTSGKWEHFYNWLQALIGYGSSHFLDEKPVVGITWLRDHVYIMKAFRYWFSDYDIKSMLELFLRHQKPTGFFFDFFEYRPDFPARPGRTYWSGVPEKYKEIALKDGVTYVRVPVEADLEFLAVEGVHLAWQATGDDEWMKKMLPQVEKGLNYTLSNPLRWSEEHSLVKRGFTIDSWDFTWFLPPTGGDWPEIIDDRTKFCIMHGDNSGVYLACKLLSKMFRYLESNSKADFWEEKAALIRKNMNQVCWNGKFYTHQVHIDPIDPPIDEKEDQMLSLSNPLDVTRGVTDHQQALSIIDEYRKRGRELKEEYFAEWFSLQPPFSKTFHTYRQGYYVNGGIWPLVGAELARAAFEHGREEYAVDILNRLYNLLKRDKILHFQYWSDGRPMVGKVKDVGGGPPAWGMARTISALVEGLAGIVDLGKDFNQVQIAPRWSAAGEEVAEVNISYGAGKGFVQYTFKWEKANKSIQLSFSHSASSVLFHLLLPQNVSLKSVREDGALVKYSLVNVEDSLYIDLVSPKSRGNLVIEYQQ